MSLYAIRLELEGGKLFNCSSPPGARKEPWTSCYAEDCQKTIDRYRLEGATVVPVRVVPTSEITVTAEFLSAADAVHKTAIKLLGKHMQAYPSCPCDLCQSVTELNAERAKIGAGK